MFASGRLNKLDEGIECGCGKQMWNRWTGCSGGGCSRLVTLDSPVHFSGVGVDL